MNLKFLITVILIFCIHNIKGQTLDEIIDHHETNLKDLYAQRGAPEKWLTTGEVDEKRLIKVLKQYEKNVAILIYSFNQDSLILSLITTKGLTKTKKSSCNPTELKQDIEDVNTLFSSQFSASIPKLRGSKVIHNKKSKHKLTTTFKKINQLLLPDDFQLREYDHIIIVPILNIATLPFAAFEVENKFLIDRMSFSIAPSLFELMVSNTINTRKTQANSFSYSWKNALFVANPKYPKDGNWDFPDLPGANKEVEQITNLISKENYTILTKEKATKTAIQKNICQYDLLYFATHGISNADMPLDHSFLVVAEEENNNSFYTMKEIMNQRYNCLLKANLVVLSACQTGLGKAHEGGIIGLARAFQIAGANHVVMSLWSINDAETAKLMEFFFKELIKENTLQPHEALRTAIVKYKKEVNNDPIYWASFSIFGIPY